MRQKMEKYMIESNMYLNMCDITDYVVGCPDNQNAYSVLVDHHSVCSGYTRATQLLLQKLGVKNLYVSGYVDGESHAWNIVKCGKHYYHVDSTWGDETDLKDWPKEFRYKYIYLCMDDKTMLKRRSIREDLNHPKCDSDKLLYYSKTSYKKMMKAVRNKLYGDLIYEVKKKNVRNAYSWDDEYYIVQLFY